MMSGFLLFGLRFRRFGHIKLIRGITLQYL